MTVNLDYHYKDNPLLPNFPGVGLLLPVDLTVRRDREVS